MARDAFRYVLSFTGEQVIEQYTGSINPVIEVALVNGRYQLNAENVNYSYGPLHDAFRRYFRLDPPVMAPDDEVLILGFGGGSVAVILREELGLPNPVTGVEVDEVVLKAAREHFNIGRLPGLTIVQEDALVFVENCSKKYKLVVVDIYLDQVVPPQFETAGFIGKLNELLAGDGKVVFNKFAGTPKLAAEVKAIEEVFRKTFSHTETFRIPVNKRMPNWMVVGRK